MGKASRRNKAGRLRRAGSDAGRLPPPRRGGRLGTAADALLHLRTPGEPVWRYFWPVLALAFAARAAVALSGDFTLHVDEIMQYLEQGHRLAFGNGIVYWEYFYGARSLLVPALIAGILKSFDAVGLGQPAWYVDGVKLAFCALSLLVPAGMYFFVRRHLDETAARVALLAGAFWYELAGFAHKPLTSFVAVALLMGLLALCARPLPDRPGAAWPSAWLAAFLAVSAAAIRLQYAPLALALLCLFLLRADWGTRRHVVVVATVLFCAVGMFDALTWDAGLFHSYANYLRFNLLYDRTGDTSPAHQYLWQLLLSSGGLGLLCLPALCNPRRYGLLLLLIVLILLPHSAEGHKEYRYIFAAVPLWLLVGAGVVTRLAGRMGRPVLVYGAAGALFAAISLSGLSNTLPGLDEVHPHESGGLLPRFIYSQDPVFAVFRHLAAAPGVTGVWYFDDNYYATPGYYYLHRRIPFYDARTGRANGLDKDLETLRASVSHLVTRASNLAVPGYEAEKTIGNVRILRRVEDEPPVRQWQRFTPTITDLFPHEFLYRIYPDAPPPPPNLDIRFMVPE